MELSRLAEYNISRTSFFFDMTSLRFVIKSADNNMYFGLFSRTFLKAFQCRLDCLQSASHGACNDTNRVRGLVFQMRYQIFSQAFCLLVPFVG